jgi:hypothetical protein
MRVLLVFRTRSLKSQRRWACVYSCATCETFQSVGDGRQARYEMDLSDCVV